MYASSPTQVCILILPESSMMSLSSVIDPLRAANRLSKQPLFSWRLLSLSGEPVELSCGIRIDVDAALSADLMGELFILVAGFNQERYAQSKHLTLIAKLSSRFNTIFAVEAATWVIARAGVIHNQKVTTHWEDLENFAFAYPKLDVLGQRFVIDGRIWTSGGASPSLDMLLHYLRLTQHQSLALDVANVFIYRESESASELQASKVPEALARREPQLGEAIRTMQAEIESPMAIADIAVLMQISQRKLELLFKRHLNLSPGAYYLRLRLQAANRLISNTNTSIGDVSVRCGFNSQSAFARAFKKRYQKSPTQLRRLSRIN